VRVKIISPTYFPHITFIRWKIDRFNWTREYWKNL